MLPVLREDECPPDPLRGWVLAILGYGNQGRAQALNLRDSGHAVVVGAIPGRSSADLASADGFGVLAPENLPARVDLVAVLTPDETHRAVVSDLASGSRGGGRIKALVFAHGFALRFDPPALDPSWDVAVVAPAGPGVQLRSRFLEGSGIPALLAVHRDASGSAAERARAYAGSLGCARAGVLVTSVADETEVDLFGEQAVLCGGMNALCRAAFETLTAAGYSAEMAYLECVHQLRLTAELVEKFGVEGMRRRISRTALYGDLTRGPRLIDPGIQARMAEILKEIRSGDFARDWLRRAGDPTWPDADVAGARLDSMEQAGEVIRGLYRRKSVDSPDGLG
jgi:ketol-acid reductoisomerase